MKPLTFSVLEHVVNTYKITSYNNFWVVNGRIYKKDQVPDLRELNYKQITNALKDGLLFAPHPVKDALVINDYFRDNSERKHWTERLFKKNLPPYTKKQLNDLDEDPSSLYYFTDGALYDFNMKRVSVPFHIDYIDGHLSNVCYDLVAVHKHLKKLAITQNISFSDIKKIPWYNNDSSTGEYIELEVLLKQKDFDKVAVLSKEPSPSGPESDTFGRFYMDWLKRYDAVLGVLGVNKFKKETV
jgi:hypothetical protein